MNARPEFAPSDEVEALYRRLLPQVAEIDLDRDLNETETPHLLGAMAVSASSGDRQVYGDEFLKFGVLAARGVITREQWLSLEPLIEASERT